MSKKNPEESEEDYFEQMMGLQGVKSLDDEAVQQQKGLAHFEDYSGKFAGKPQEISNNTRRKIKLSRYVQPDDTIDLHGSTREEAIHKVQNFILSSVRYKYNVVLIITGKGLNSGLDGPVLKNAVWSWLEQNKKNKIIDFAEAPPRLGGGGAIIVYLKQ